MYKICLPLLLFSCLFSSDSHYKVDIKNKDGVTHTYVNHAEVFCTCGKPPVITLFIYGTPEHYCCQHAPEIEYVHSISRDEIEDIIKSLGK